MAMAMAVAVATSAASARGMLARRSRGTALRFDLLGSEPAGAAWPWETSVTSPARRTPQPVS
jgi:hypothetical protein